MRLKINRLIVLKCLVLAGCAGNGDGNVVEAEVPTAPPNEQSKLYGMDCVDALYSEYGEGAPRGRGPSQGLIIERGNAYLNDQFPELDYIRKASVIELGEEGEADAAGIYHVLFETSAGDFVIEVHEDWAPRGAARFRELVEAGFYDECRFFRVIEGFMAQVGMNGDPEVQAEWQFNTIEDDPVVESNTRGYVSFATSGPDSRTCQFFINYDDNSRLDAMGFAPFGKVIDVPADVIEASRAVSADAEEGEAP